MEKKKKKPTGFLCWVAPLCSLILFHQLALTPARLVTFTGIHTHTRNRFVPFSFEKRKENQLEVFLKS
jgi:hypothetical protein